MRLLFFILSLFVFCSCSVQKVTFSENSLLEPKPVSDSLKVTSGFTEVFLPTPDSLRVHGMYLKNDTNKKSVLYFHSTRDNLWSESLVQKLQTIHDNGYNVLAVDYANYGKSKGNTSVENMLMTSDYAFDYIQVLFKETSIIVWGHSIGCVSTFYLAAEQKGDMFISEGTLSNLIDLEQSLEKQYSTNNTRVDLQIDSVRLFSNEQLVKSIKQSTIFIHGENDGFAPYYEAQGMFDTILIKEKRFITLSGEDHYYKRNKTVVDYMPQVKTFINMSINTLNSSI